MLVKKEIGRSLRHGMVQYAPHILTGLGVAGVYLTAIFASKATLKAAKIVEDENRKNEESRQFFASDEPAPIIPPLTRKEIVNKTWKCYIPSALISLLTAGCIIKSGRIYSKRNAALLALYSISETAFREYQSKVKEMIGDGKEGKIRDSVARDKIIKNPSEIKGIVITGGGEALCYDAPSARYFRSDIEKIRRKENDFNQALRSEMRMTLNELYYELGLEPTKMGDNLGWDIDKGLLEFKFSSQLTENGSPCLVIDYEIHPLY